MLANGAGMWIGVDFVTYRYFIFFSVRYRKVKLTTLTKTCVCYNQVSAIAVSAIKRLFYKKHIGILPGPKNSVRYSKVSAI